MAERELNFHSYYLQLEATGVYEVDVILSAVARAGKAFHSTESWYDEDAWPEEPFEGRSWNDRIQNAGAAAASALRDARADAESARAELSRLREAAMQEDNEISQRLGKALGYPWYKDDQQNFPGATEADGVCVGDHVGLSLAAEAADALESARRECERVRERVIDLSQGVTDRGHGLCWWCCDAPYRGGDSPHREDCFLTGPEGLLSLFSGAALSGEDPPEVMG